MTTPVRIDNDIIQMARDHKTATGFPIGRFIEDAIVEKVFGLPLETRQKMGPSYVTTKKSRPKKKQNK